MIQVVAYGGRVHRLPMRSGSSFAHLAGGRTVVPVASVDRVRERVEAAYQRLDLPAWPDPHPDGASPSDEEYSRVTDPDRYRIVPARARLWAEELAALPGVAAEPLPARPGSVADRRPAGEERYRWGMRISSSTSGTLPLLLIAFDVRLTDQVGWLPVLRLSVARPEAEVTALPECGCDACDRGSADLLGAVDEAIARVIGGPFVLLRHERWHAQWYPGGGSSGGSPRAPDHSRLMELCRSLAAGERVRLPSGTEAFVGLPWFDQP